MTNELSNEEAAAKFYMWHPIETALKNGSPIWVRGYNYGQSAQGYHCCWAWWDGANWIGSDMTEDGQTILLHLVEWMPLYAPPQPQGESNGC